MPQHTWPSGSLDQIPALILSRRAGCRLTQTVALRGRGPPTLSINSGSLSIGVERRLSGERGLVPGDGEGDAYDGSASLLSGGKGTARAARRTRWGQLRSSVW